MAVAVRREEFEPARWVGLAASEAVAAVLWTHDGETVVAVNGQQVAGPGRTQAVWEWASAQRAGGIRFAALSAAELEARLHPV